MDEVAELAFALRRQCKTSAAGLSGQFNEAENASPISAFAMIYNHATITAELLHYYKAVWSKNRKVTPEERDQMREENGARVMEVTKTTFILSLSAIEHNAKQALKNWQDALPIDWSRRVYLGQIIEKSFEAGWIDEDIQKKMKDLIFVRNCLVHNNGVSDENRKLLHPTGKPYEAKEGQMLQGNLKLFLECACVACDAFQTWSASFLTAKHRA